ncbi:MAG: hypothetical protein H6Q37_2245 [Chloroflexi bacterium]|nr:hypothetical protein [Chloroflexota bacterium]
MVHGISPGLDRIVESFLLDSTDTCTGADLSQLY